MLCIKNSSAISVMAEGGRLLAKTMQELENNICEGKSTLELDRLAHKYIISNGAKPSFLGMYGFPNTLCISVNDEVIHGIPSKKRILKSGDIVSIDAGVYLKGFHTDMARTFIVGEASQEVCNLVERTKQSFFEGISAATVGNRISDISHAIEEYINQFGYGIVRNYTGHGVGRELHEDPSIPNFGAAGHGQRIVNGMTLAIEPMINLGCDKVKTLADGWTVVTSDGAKSAHYENTIAIVDGKAVILTDTKCEL